MGLVAHEQLPRKLKPSPGWFLAAADKLRTLIAKRDAALDARHRQPTPATAITRMRAARAALQLGLRQAQSDWILRTCSSINDGANGAAA